MIAGFDIEYNINNFSLIEDLNDTVSRTGYLYNMPLQLIELTAQFGKEVNLVRKTKECLTICRCRNKGSTFSSVILRL